LWRSAQAAARGCETAIDRWLSRRGLVAGRSIAPPETSLSDSTTSRPGSRRGTVDLLSRRQINRVGDYPLEPRPRNLPKKGASDWQWKLLARRRGEGPFPGSFRVGHSTVCWYGGWEVKQVLLLLSGGAHHRKYYRSGGKRRPPAPTASHCCLTFAGVLPRGDGRERRSSGTAQASVPPSHGSPYPPAM
jgi:hypothetical protein